MKSTYWDQLDQVSKQSLADKADTSVEYLRQIFKYEKTAGRGMARCLSEETRLPITEFRPEYHTE